MPVIPDCIPPFKIHAPTTSGDNGAPTASLLKDAERVFQFMQDERHLTAEKLYLNVKQRLDDWNAAAIDASSKPRNRFSVKRGSSHTSKLSKQEQEKSADEAQQVQTLLDQKEELLMRFSVRRQMALFESFRTTA
jgi:hypothetical protein